MKGLRMLLTTSLCRAATTLAPVPPHFQQWFPNFGDAFDEIMQQNCSLEYQEYLQGASPLCPDNSHPRCVAGRVVDCVLEATTESRKANMAAGAVLLGVMPTTLVFASPSTLETGLLAMRRPILALLVGAGSPAISPLHSLKYRKVQDMLDPPALPVPGCVSTLLVPVQYLVAIGATANIIHTTLQLCAYIVCSFAPEVSYLPALWAILSVPLHMAGALGVFLCIEMKSNGEKISWLKRFAGEFRPRPRLHPPKVIISLLPESWWFIIASWLTSVGVLLYIFFGTLVFSSVLFISTQDAAYVAFRYLGSTIGCRIVLRSELNRMKGEVEFVQEDDTCWSWKGRHATMYFFPK
ncbi:hypothetical protein GQ53DRAFT_816307 [Thozetella sp. PMI_491]|nr:hypothetical protein GQ53DRAFT_816307 [Thozetella sp. PMI_491]